MTTTMNLPAIPEISGDVNILLDIYTHRSLRLPNSPMNEEYGNADRLAVLGATTLDFSVTRYLYFLRPPLSITEIRDRANDIMSDTNIDIWLRLYQMKERLLVSPNEAHAILNDPDEMKRYFYTFLGAVRFRNGLPAVENWISALLNWSSAAANGVGTNHAANVDMDGNAGNPV